MSSCYHFQGVFIPKQKKYQPYLIELLNAFQFTVLKKRILPQFIWDMLTSAIFLKIGKSFTKLHKREKDKPSSHFSHVGDIKFLSGVWVSES